MPYYRKKQPRRKRRTTKQKMAPMRKLERRVKRLEKLPELKYTDSFDILSPINATGTLLCGHYIAQGDDYNQRIGEEVASKYVNYKVRIQHNAAAGSDKIRIILFWDKQTNGVGPGIKTSVAGLNTALLDDTVITDVTLIPFNYRTSERYAVLYDKVHVIDPDSSAVDVNRFIRINKKLNGARIKYSSSAGSGYGNITTRSLNMLLISNGGLATTTTSVACRFWFTDQ